jgi:hypothetical protein
MSSGRFFTTTIAALIAVAGATYGLPAQAQDICVPYRDVRQIHMNGTDAAIVQTQRGNYNITFRNACQVEQRGEFFVLDRFQLGQCVSPGNVFESSGTAAPCTIESVAPLRDLMQNEGE